MRIISGELGGRRLKTINAAGYRPATDKVRQAVFSMLEARGLYWPETRAADLFAGSGSLGLECLSRGAPEVWFVEKNRKALSFIKDNLQELQISAHRYCLCPQEVTSWLRKKQPVLFDLIFIDPPYGHGLVFPVLKTLINQGWIGSQGLILAEVESKSNVHSENFPNLELLLSRTYGQTRICLWKAKDRK